MTKKHFTMDPQHVVSIRDLVLDYEMKHANVRANDNVSFDIRKHAMTALVGESGSGKTTVASAIINTLLSSGRIVSGQIWFNDDDRVFDVTTLSEQDKLKFRWEKVSMVFQGAQSALNPVVTIYHQFKETMRVHDPHIKDEDIRNRSVEVLEYVNLEAERVMKLYPHELSGGMKQRVMIAFALLLNPKLIILDEPTTALDVITQDYIFKLLQQINKDLDIAMLLLTHDIGVVAKYADYVGVMYAGRIVEFGDTFTVFKESYHPYTRGLIRATPSLHLSVSDLRPIGGTPPDLLKLPSGCVFHPRCPKAMECCAEIVPKPHFPVTDHVVVCHLYGEGDCDE